MRNTYQDLNHFYEKIKEQRLELLNSMVKNLIPDYASYTYLAGKVNAMDDLLNRLEHLLRSS